MDDRSDVAAALRPALIGGLVSGLVGALLFATAHALIIAPIWGRMWSGLVWGSLAGMAAGWALVEVVPSVVAVSWGRAAALGAALGAALWLLVTPVTLADAVLRRLAVAERSDVVEVTVAVTLAIASGAGFAWWRTHRWRASIAGALATVSLTVAMAGPVPIGRTPRALWIFLAVLPASVLAGVVLAVVVRLAQPGPLRAERRFG